MAPTDFVTAIGGHPLVADILWERGYTTLAAVRAFLDPDQYTPASAGEMPGMSEAVERLRSAVALGQHIRVWGDFDVDGQTSVSLLLLGLRELGAHVDYTIPNRAEHSHGLNPAGILRARDEGVQVLLTCDCGAADFDEIALARRSGLDVVVSDHHDLARDGDVCLLPEACAVVNPRRLPPGHPLASLPGVGVAYKLMEAMLAESPAHLLDLVALGIVADVAYQRDDTRYLLQRGLERLRTSPRPGMRALMQMAGLEPAGLTADHIGFQIGPRLNAVGRLDNAELSVELLTTDDEARAVALAKRVETLNQERKVLQHAVEEEAFHQLARDPGALRNAVIVLSSDKWHASLLGVVAATVSNRTNKPAILISAPPGVIGRGSARSVPGIDIHAAITAQGADAGPGERLIENSGGHPLAAGFGIRAENVPAFGESVNAYVAAHATAAGRAETPIDAVLPWRDVSLPLALDLERLAPFGPGNLRPVLKSVRLKAARVEAIGKDGKHQAVWFQDEDGQRNRVTWWRSNGQTLPDSCDLVFTLHADSYHGKQRLNVQAVRIEPAAADVPSNQIGAHFRVRDLRGQLDRRAALAQLAREYGADAVAVWAEGAGAASAPVEGLPASQTRLQLQPRPVLVIWSIPPGPDELAAVLSSWGSASLQTVVLLTGQGLDVQDPRDPDQPDFFMRQLAGMIKRSERQGDSLDDEGVIARMAARIGQRVETVKAGIACWRQGKNTSDTLSYLLGETRAYRRYFQEASAGALLASPFSPTPL